uniref:Uncharacterized protein n=1 Tax=Acrobeloides nanus TaxID=290746 RepID=A0A914DPG4_9BILA
MMLSHEIKQEPMVNGPPNQNGHHIMMFGNGRAPHMGQMQQPPPPNHYGRVPCCKGEFNPQDYFGSQKVPTVIR